MADKNKTTEKTVEKNPKRMQGVVASNSMQKTLVVRVDRLVEHPKYKKRYTVSRRYKAHYEDGEFNVGDKVTIQESKPASKEKRWRVIQDKQ